MTSSKVNNAMGQSVIGGSLSDELEFQNIGRRIDCLRNTCTLMQLFCTLSALYMLFMHIQPPLIAHTIHAFLFFQWLNYCVCNVSFWRSVNLKSDLGLNEPKNLMLEKNSTTESVLGMTWNHVDDCFSYSFNLREDVHSILDGLGLGTST